jgi:hypothetical protein
MATRYKVTKEQLERIVESFVMEEASKSKAPVKNMIPSQGAEAKKHVKNKMSGSMVDHSEGMPSVSQAKKKNSQAPEAKKHVSNSTMKHSNKAKVVKEEEEMGSNENQGLDFGAVFKDIKSDIPKLSSVMKNKIKSTDNMSYMEGDDNLKSMNPNEVVKTFQDLAKSSNTPRVRQAIEQLGAVKEDGTIDMQKLGEKSVRDKVVGKIMKIAGMGTAFTGLVSAGVAWLSQSEHLNLMSSGVATTVAISGLIALVAGATVGVIGAQKEDTAKTAGGAKFKK